MPTASSRQTQRSAHVLPVECIICQKTKTITDFERKRKIEPLRTCEEDAEKLLAAAREKNDERILLNIGDLDPVCIEVRYHPSCYKQYVKCLYKKEPSPRPLTQTFESFCADVIDKRIISDKEVMTMNTLTRIFIKQAKEIEDMDIGGYRNYQLKDRLIKKYPQLQFTQIKSCASELVLLPSTKPHMSRVQTLSDVESETSSSQDSEVDLHPNVDKHNVFTQLYHCARELCNTLHSIQGLSGWPPSAGSLTLAECKNIIPAELLNFLTWCTGLDEDFTTDCVNVENDDYMRKIISIAQDIIALSSRGRKLMPKHVALGMTIRHLTGSAKIQQILNNFGHCVSHSTTLEHDTALATQQLEAKTVPPEFLKQTFTTLVWDNNDFGEETLTGNMRIRF